jgi:sugar phosphate permease
MAGKWMYLGATALSVAAIMSTPLLGTWFPVLAAVMVLRGFFQGVSAPVMFTYMSRSVAPSEQGLSIGLRSTANRVSSLTMPILMGATADIIGIGHSFFVIGAIFDPGRRRNLGARARGYDMTPA